MKIGKRIVIVGAGPIGCYLAQLLKEKGVNSLLIEEHKEIGRPIHCAGLVGKKVFAETKIPLSSDCILNTINGAVIHLGKHRLVIRKEKVAYVIDREKFDKKLGEGLEIRFETKFLGLEKENGAYLVETERGHLKTDIVVGAEGAKSSVRDFISPNHIEYLKGVQFRLAIKAHYPDMVEVDIRRPYFYWIIPESKDVVRIGVLSQNPYQDLLAFIKERKLKGKILDKFAGIVPFTHPPHLSKERIFLVGDSASQIKPLSYGGIYMGMRGAEMLCECILKDRFLEYSNIWKKRFGREIETALKMRRLFSRLTGNDIEKIFTFIKENVDIIEKKGDFENHSQLVWEFLKHATVPKDIFSILFKIIKQNLAP
jgi:geranylgeranyl reductase family protein